MEEDYINKPKEDFIGLEPKWHMELGNIDLNRQPDSLIEKYTSNGYHIYKSSWDDLYNALNPSYEDLYKSTELWTDEQDKYKIARIIENWEKQMELIPPMLIDNGYNQLVPADGKHRMKVASIFNQDEMTFILFDIDLPKINEYFKPTLVD